MLTIKNFSKCYNDLLVLAVKDLAFPPGIHWIKGENGSGKSTLFKCISGLLPFQGSIQLGNTDLKRNPILYRRMVNFSEAEPLYPGFLTAKDIVRFIAKTKGASVKQQQYYLEMLGVVSFFEKSCETFSSGMLKKLSLALAFLGEPKVIVLDESLITLDAQARIVLCSLIEELVTKDVIFLMSSHQQLEDTSLSIITSLRIENKSLVIEGDYQHTK